MKIAIIGTGNLGCSIAIGLISEDAITSLYLTKRNLENIQEFKGYSNVFLTTDNKEAIENVTNSFVKLGLQYKKYNFDKMAINMLNQMVQKQLISSNENKDELILLLKTGMAKLIE